MSQSERVLVLVNVAGCEFKLSNMKSDKYIKNIFLIVWPWHITSTTSLEEKSCSIKVWSQTLPEPVFPEEALWSLFWFGVIYRSIKQDCSSRAWGNKTVFQLVCRNHTDLWGVSFLPVTGKATAASKFQVLPKPGNVWLAWVHWKSRSRITRMFLKIASSLRCFDLSCFFHQLLWQFETKS